MRRVQFRIREARGHSMKQWNYLLEEISSKHDKKEEIEVQLNDLGKDGWEIVSVWPQNFLNNTGSRLHVLFKRPTTPDGP